MNKIIIGITGRTGSNQIAGCGKDTVADMITSYTFFNRYRFSQPLYDMIKVGFRIELESRELKSDPIGWLSDETKKISLRNLLETLGTEWGRNCVRDDVWVRIADKFFHESLSSIVISDVRFKNEVDWIDKNPGSCLIHVVRSNHFNGEATVGHSSNRPLPIRPQDIVIDNTRTLRDLNRDVIQLCRERGWV